MTQTPPRREDGDDDILEVLRERWSPRAFDPGHQLTNRHASLLLEAARWAPSAGNSQPWAFHLVHRGAPAWKLVASCLLGSSRSWATQASALVVNLAHTRIDGTDLDYSEFAAYDLGQAVAHMTIQAHSMGLACRQFRAFDKEALTERLAVPEHWEILSMTAIGRTGPDARRGPRASQRDPAVTWPRD